MIKKHNKLQYSIEKLVFETKTNIKRLRMIEKHCQLQYLFNGNTVFKPKPTIKPLTNFATK